MNHLSSITVIQHFIGSFSLDTFFKNLTPLQRKVGAIALSAIACFVAICLACRYCLKEKFVNQQAADIDDIEPEGQDVIQENLPEEELANPNKQALDFIKKRHSLFKPADSILRKETQKAKSDLDAQPNNLSRMLIYGEALQTQGLHQKACEIFKKAWSLILSKEPSDSRNKYLMISISYAYSQSLVILGRYEAALDLLKQAASLNHALAINPYGGEYYIYDLILCSQGHILQLQGKEKDAQDKFEEALTTLNPKFEDFKSHEAFILREYGVCFYLQNKPLEAIEKLQASLALNQQDKITLYIYGEVLHMQGKNKDALKKFKKALTPAQFAEMKENLLSS